MVYAGLFLLGAIVGVASAKIMLILTSTKDAENYPLGGFVPAILVVFDFGQTSTLLGAGTLVLGGLFGYYLLITIWARYMMKGPAPHVVDQKDTKISTSLSDYLG